MMFFSSPLFSPSVCDCFGKFYEYKESKKSKFYSHYTLSVLLLGRVKKVKQISTSWTYYCKLNKWKNITLTLTPHLTVE